MVWLWHRDSKTHDTDVIRPASAAETENNQEKKSHIPPGNTFQQLKIEIENERGCSFALHAPKTATVPFDFKVGRPGQT